VILFNENICIFGRRGSGKSTLCKNLQNLFNNKFIFDTLYEYNESNTFRSYTSFSQYVINTQKENNIKAVVQLDFESAKNNEIFDEFIKIIYHRTNATIVIEEVQNFANVHKIPDFLKQASLTGRHKNVNFITTTQRIAEIHKTLLSQAHHIFAGYTDSPNDLKTLKEYGFSTDEIINLNNYEFIWKFGRNKIKIKNDLSLI
jgi:dephospho-CoA kinase